MRWYVAVGLALHTVTAKVGEDAESSGRHRFSKLRQRLPNLRKDGRLPKLLLAKVGRGDSQQHDGNPRQLILDDDEFVLAPVEGCVGDSPVMIWQKMQFIG